MPALGADLSTVKAKKVILGGVISILGVAMFLGASFLAHGLVISWIFTSGDIPHKSDEELIANFQANRSEF
jgi:hypothetical protein